MKEISVLIVENCFYSTDLNVRELKKAGFIVDYQMVSSEKPMEEALKKRKWDLILSDNSMPNFSALRALDVRNKVDGRIPFIIVSEDIPLSEVYKAYEEGCCAYLPKEHLSELRNLVKKVLSENFYGGNADDNP